MLTDEQYRELREKYDRHYAAMKQQYPGQNALTQDELATLPPAPTNAETSAIEVYEFVHNPPEKYTVYVYPDRNEVGTWTGDTLGTIVSWGASYRSNMGDKRRSITFRGINGRTYSGTFYESSGDLAHVRAVKGSN